MTYLLAISMEKPWLTISVSSTLAPRCVMFCDVWMFCHLPPQNPKGIAAFFASRNDTGSTLSKLQLAYHLGSASSVAQRYWTSFLYAFYRVSSPQKIWEHDTTSDTTSFEEFIAYRNSTSSNVIMTRRLYKSKNKAEQRSWIASPETAACRRKANAPRSPILRCHKACTSLGDWIGRTFLSSAVFDVEWTWMLAALWQASSDKTWLPTMLPGMQFCLRCWG